MKFGASKTSRYLLVHVDKYPATTGPAIATMFKVHSSHMTIISSSTCIIPGSESDYSCSVQHFRHAAPQDLCRPN